MVLIKIIIFHSMNNLDLIGTKKYIYLINVITYVRCKENLFNMIWILKKIHNTNTIKILIHGLQNYICG